MAYVGRLMVIVGNATSMVPAGQYIGKELGHMMITAQLLPARAPALSLLAPPPAGQGQGRSVEQCCSWVIPSSHHHTARPGPGPGEMMGSQGEVEHGLAL